jgi:hypothetical protein
MEGGRWGANAPRENPANLWAAVLGGLGRWGPVWAPQQMAQGQLGFFVLTDKHFRFHHYLFFQHVGPPSGIGMDVEEVLLDSYS